jgi:hypothetical protein
MRHRSLRLPAPRRSGPLPPQPTVPCRRTARRPSRDRVVPEPRPERSASSRSGMSRRMHPARPAKSGARDPQRTLFLPEKTKQNTVLTAQKRTSETVLQSSFGWASAPDLPCLGPRPRRPPGRFRRERLAGKAGPSAFPVLSLPSPPRISSALHPDGRPLHAPRLHGHPPMSTRAQVRAERAEPEAASVPSRPSSFRAPQGSAPAASSSPRRPSCPGATAHAPSSASSLPSRPPQAGRRGAPQASRPSSCSPSPSCSSPKAAPARLVLPDPRTGNHRSRPPATPRRDDPRPSAPPPRRPRCRPNPRRRRRPRPSEPRPAVPASLKRPQPRRRRRRPPRPEAPGPKFFSMPGSRASAARRPIPRSPATGTPAR